MIEKTFHEIADSTEPQFDLRTVPVPERDIVDGRLATYTVHEQHQMRLERYPAYRQHIEAWWQWRARKDAPVQPAAPSIPVEKARPLPASQPEPISDSVLNLQIGEGRRETLEYLYGSDRLNEGQRARVMNAMLAM